VLARGFAWLVLPIAVAAAAQAEDDSADFERWLQSHSVGEFEQFLAASNLNGVIPTRHLLRTATDWRRCNGPRFEIPPREHWPQVRSVLALLAELKKRRIVKDVEGASGYRNPQLNACAQGAPKSSHTRSFALDISGAPGQIDTEALCSFWRKEGKEWSMGLSRYPSGRIHVDTSGWRTWGSDHKRGTAFCAPPR
jgi:uncharacterized protein YcbK (DUF882 family)